MPQLGLALPAPSSQRCFFFFFLDFPKQNTYVPYDYGD